MPLCIACNKEYSCGCQMYKKKYCNEKCEELFLNKIKNEQQQPNSELQELQQPPSPALQNR